MTICAPSLVSCQCERWSIGRGETLPLTIDWSEWLDSVPDFALHGTPLVSLTDMNVIPEVLANPADIDTVPTLADPVDPQNPPAYFVQDETCRFAATRSLIKVGADVDVGKLYRYDITISAKDCNNRIISAKACVVIQICR